MSGGIDAPVILWGFLGSLAAGLATVVGALPILVIGRPSERQQATMLGFAAGVMLAASFLSLILPGIAQAQAMGASKLGAATAVVAAVLVGAMTIAAANARLPALGEWGLGPAGIAGARFRRVWLFVAAITLHNFPEGMAVGVSFGGGDLAAGQATALGIGLQNMPEGLAVAASLAALGYSRGKSVLAALASGLFEPLAGLCGATVVAAASGLLPYGLGFAGGAMIYVVASEILPDAQGRLAAGGRATAGLMIGLAAMTILDTSFA